MPISARTVKYTAFAAHGPNDLSFAEFTMTTPIDAAMERLSLTSAESGSQPTASPPAATNTTNPQISVPAQATNHSNHTVADEDLLYMKQQFELVKAELAQAACEISVNTAYAAERLKQMETEGAGLDSTRDEVGSQRALVRDEINQLQMQMAALLVHSAELEARIAKWSEAVEELEKLLA
jgi:hypothetical protein